MQQPLQITIRDIPHSKAVEDHIREKAEKLNQFSEHIIGCQVVVELTQKHQNNGKLHSIHIKVNLPGKELAVTHNEAENLYIAIRDAFDTMVRNVCEYMEMLRGDVKNHSLMLHGKIVRLMDGQDFGFIEGTNGTEYYFNANNVAHPHFKKLKIGTPVHFIEAMGDEGPQAHRVKAQG